MFTERIESGYAIIRDSGNKLAVLLPRTNYLKKSFAIEVQLPCDLRRKRSFNRCKQLLGRHIDYL